MASLNLSFGMKVMVGRARIHYWEAPWAWYAGIVERVEMIDGEEWVSGHWMKIDENAKMDPHFCVPREHVRSYEVR